MFPELLSTRVYDVADLVQHDSYEEFDSLIDVLSSLVQPDTWADNGGLGAVQPFGTDRLVISQTWHVHAEVAELLHRLRAQRGLASVSRDRRVYAAHGDSSHAAASWGAGGASRSGARGGVPRHYANDPAGRHMVSALYGATSRIESR